MKGIKRGGVEPLRFIFLSILLRGLPFSIVDFSPAMTASRYRQSCSSDASLPS
jgi:hypothetical protein